MYRKERNQVGFSTIEFIMGAVLMTFVVFFPIASQMEMHTIHKMEQELDRALQMAAVEGGTDGYILSSISHNLREHGITPLGFTTDTTTGQPVNKGGMITVGIRAERPTKSLYSGVMSLVGGDDIESDIFVVKGTIMSEYIP